jgi:hypothetical protein
MDWPEQPLVARDSGAYEANGVDVSLIRWTLRMTPGERLRFHDQQIHSIEKLRGAARKQNQPARAH